MPFRINEGGTAKLKASVPHRDGSFLLFWTTGCGRNLTAVPLSQSYIPEVKPLPTTGEILSRAVRIVIKVGTSTLTHASGKLNYASLEKIVRETTDLKHQGKEIILVTSGAVGAGIGRTNYAGRPNSVQEKQALAAIGQGILMHAYEKLFAEYGQIIAQVLLTRADVADRKHYANSYRTFLTLLQFGAIPIVNENDTVATEEIKFGDNDTLSALVASMVNADLLVILSDINGLYTADPRRQKDARLIPVVEKITGELEECAAGAGTARGTGGMRTKIAAAKIATNSGAAVLLANGQEAWVVRRALAGEQIGTVFLPQKPSVASRKRWFAFGAISRGAVTVDKGAEQALRQEGKSLLPSGVVAVAGSFLAGQSIRIISLEGQEIGCGIVNYPAADLQKLAGKQTADIEAILGYKNGDEVIHRDALVLV